MRKEDAIRQIIIYISNYFLFFCERRATRGFSFFLGPSSIHMMGSSRTLDILRVPGIYMPTGKFEVCRHQSSLCCPLSTIIYHYYRHTSYIYMCSLLLSSSTTSSLYSIAAVYTHTWYTAAAAVQHAFTVCC